MWRKISVSSMYGDELENMSDSEFATLDLKITVVNADEGCSHRICDNGPFLQPHGR